MEIDLSTISISDEDRRRTAEKMCAYAVAYEVYADGVEWVSIKANRKGPGRYLPNNTTFLETTRFDLVVCRLAGLAWSVVYHHEEDYQKAEETRLQVNRAINGDPDITRGALKEAVERADDGEELEEAWEEAKRFVRDWSDFIEHAAGRLMDNYKELDEPTLEGEEIRRYVNNPSAYGLERS